jgi:CBS domain-containing protein
VFPSSASPCERMRVRDLPTRPIPVIPSHLSMAAARKVAALKRIALLLVERNECLIGAIDERALATAGDQACVIDCLSPFDPCLRQSMSIEDARQRFIAARAAVLPVVAAGFVVGAIARGDVERHLDARHSSATKRTTLSVTAAA